MMFETNFISAIPAARFLIHIKAVKTDASAFLPYEKKEELAKLCREGCPDYNTSWSCPPNSPSFSRYLKDFPKALLVIYFAKMDQFSTIPEEKRVRGANMFLRLNLEKHLRYMEKLHHGLMLSTGICRLCSRCTCIDHSAPCRWPKEMRCSMESLGLNVADITRDFLNYSLAWGGSGQLPEYVSSVGCLLTKEPVDPERIPYLL